jgi:hypothetical protein
MDNTEIRAQYMRLADEKGKRPRDMAVSDFFKGIDRLKGT